MAGAVVVLNEISKLKKVEEQLKESNTLLKRRTQDLETLVEITRGLGASLKQKKIYSRMAKSSREILEGDVSLIFRYSKPDNSLILKSASGFEQESSERIVKVIEKSWLYSFLLNLKSARIVPDMSLFETPPVSEGLNRIKSGVFVPLFIKNEFFGVMAVFSKSHRRFTRDAIEVLHSIGKSGALALENAALYQELKSLDELKSNIIANVSHELRTPITIVGTALRLICEEGDVEEREKLFQRGKEALKRLDFVVDDLIETAKLELGGERAKPYPLDITGLIESVPGDFQPIAKRNGVELKVATRGRLNAMADAKRVMRVLRGLISNAIKFTGEGGEVFVTGRRTPGTVEVCVSDTGIGIPKEEQERIFESFYQVDSSATRRYGGTGMGLAMVRKMVESLGGEIGIESEPGKGSTFCFTLPEAGWGGVPCKPSESEG